MYYTRLNIVFHIYDSIYAFSLHSRPISYMNSFRKPVRISCFHTSIYERVRLALSAFIVLIVLISLFFIALNFYLFSLIRLMFVPLLALSSPYIEFWCWLWAGDW